MKQQDFIWLAKSLNIDNVSQDEIGNTIVQLKPNIQIIHKYKKNDRMEIYFQEDRKYYHIPSETELKQIYILYTENENLTEVLRIYCEENLKE
jgi:hypothetical protein